MKMQELKEHLELYKDALILVGPGAITSRASIPTKEEQIQYLNNKYLRRNPDEFWEFFFNRFYIDRHTGCSETYKAINTLYSWGFAKNIVTLYPDGLLDSVIKSTDIIHLHGNMQLFQCQKASCKTIYPIDYVLDEDNKRTECELCGKRLRPKILLSGESYDNEKYQAMIKLLNTTHTLVTIGLDYTETPILDLIADYCDLKKASKEPKILVSVVNKDLDMDLNEQIGFHEFIVKDDCDPAMLRLIEALK